jgi:hypothetical protein
MYSPSFVTGVTIAAGVDAQSATIDLETLALGTGLPAETGKGMGYRPCAVLVPNGWVAGDLVFLASQTAAGTYSPLWRAAADGTPQLVRVTLPLLGAARWVAFNPVDFAGVRYLRLQSPADQTATRTLVVAFRPALIL